MNSNLDLTENSPQSEPNPFVNEMFMFRGRLVNDFTRKIRAGNINLPSEYYTDTTPKINKYRNLGIMETALKLSPAAVRVWIWIEYHLKYRHDHIILDKVAIMEKLGITRQTFRAAIVDLELNHFVRQSLNPKTKDVYFINPRIIFYGNRGIMYPKHVKETSKKK